jgi:hypothetical protein
MKTTEDQLFDAGMDMAWAMFDCPWEYLTKFQKFTVRLTVALFYVAGWINGRFAKWYKPLDF